MTSSLGDSAAVTTQQKREIHGLGIDGHGRWSRDADARRAAVLDLVASGARNGEVALALELSPRTVDATLPPRSSASSACARRYKLFAALLATNRTTTARKAVA